MVLVDNIKAYCEAREITIAEFERMCGLSNGIVRHWKDGRNRTANVATLARIESATGIEISRWIKVGGLNGRIKPNKGKSKRAGKKAE